MNAMRNGPPPPVPHHIERKYKEELRESAFYQLVAGKVLEEYLDELDEAGISPEHVRQLAASFAELSEHQKRAILAYPAVLRPALFERFAKKIESGELSPQQVVDELLAKAMSAGFTIGFHLSQADIKPTKDDWKVIGTEKDHRHDDLPMAYYSLDYAHRYLKKPSRFLYVVRVEKNDESGHYRDNDGTWGHAPSLAIVAKVDLLELEAELDKRMRTLTAEGKKTDKEAA